MKHKKPEAKEVIVGTRWPLSLLTLVDEEACDEGTSRSHIIRRIVRNHFKQKSENVLHPVG